MKSARICLALVVIVASSFAAQAASDSNQPDIDSANRLFEVGKFAEARELYARMAAQDPKDYSATLQLGRIALLFNRHCHVNRKFAGQMIMAATVHAATVAWRHVSIA